MDPVGTDPMPSHRSLRMAEAIREVVATAILFEVADPRVRAVTVLRAEVSGDLRQAKVYVSIMGTEPERRRALEGLNHAAGFLQARVAARLQTRFTPVLSFKLDDSVQKAVELGRLIDEAVASDRKGDASSRPDDAPTAPGAEAEGGGGGEPDAEDT
jgi:ribosome-binding factor A